MPVGTEVVNVTSHTPDCVNSVIMTVTLDINTNGRVAAGWPSENMSSVQWA